MSYYCLLILFLSFLCPFGCRYLSSVRYSKTFVAEEASIKSFASAGNRTSVLWCYALGAVQYATTNDGFDFSESAMFPIGFLRHLFIAPHLTVGAISGGLSWFWQSCIYYNNSCLRFFFDFVLHSLLCTFGLSSNCFQCSVHSLTTGYETFELLIYFTYKFS